MLYFGVGIVECLVVIIVLFVPCSCPPESSITISDI
jgi:hypothetical protein